LSDLFSGIDDYTHNIKLRVISSVYDKALNKKLVELTDLARLKLCNKEEQNKCQEAMLMIISQEIQRILSRMTGQVVHNAKQEVFRRN
jgi:hypothetical protein